MVKRFRINVPVFDHTVQERTAYIYLPPSYDTEPDKRYPVLYMFDGHNVFFDSDATYGKSWGMANYLEQHRTPILVAAVECNHSPDHGRLKEYAPFDFALTETGFIPGHGKETMEWLIHTFKKQIDRDYRTLPDREHTFIAGSSMGGLMSLYALLAYNSTFSRAAALSPSLWIAPEKVLNMIHRSTIGEMDIEHPSLLYMDYGSAEFENHKGSAVIFKKTAAALLGKNILLNCRIVPNGSHCEASWERQIPFFMNTLLYEWR